MIYAIFGSIYTIFGLGVRHRGYPGLPGRAFQTAC